MTTNYLQQRYQEIAQYLDNDDLNRAGIRVLDVCYDFDFTVNQREKALALRIKYNKAKELGKNKIEHPHLIEEYLTFLTELKTVKLEPFISSKHTICKAKSISKEFTSKLRSFKLSALDLELTQGSIIGIVGENGNGKTTLLRMIAGDLSLDSGSIEYYFDNQWQTDWTKNKVKIAFVPQRIEKWYGKAGETVSFIAAIKGFNGAINKEKTDFIIHRMGLTNFVDHSWDQLSSGYRLRFEIAKALVWEPSILILDEPLANLDMHAQELMLNDLRNLSNSLRNPVSIVLSSQQLHEVETVSDQIIFLKNGRAVFNGNLNDFGNIEAVNTFEIAGKFDYATLNSIFGDWQDIKIEQSISAFIINCPNSYSKHDLLHRIIEERLELHYYRDITGSTKKLFNDKY